ncbi:MAG: hypothetical protein RLZZ226_126 [Pseudomonadota bacterium]
MQASTIQLIALFVLLAIFVVLVVFMVSIMMHVRKETERLRKEMLAQLGELARVTSRYQQAEYDLGLLLERVQRFLARFDLDRFLTQFEALNRKMQEPRLSPELVALTEEGLGVLEQVMETPENDLIQWREGRRQDIARLIQQKERLKTELDSLRLRAEESDREVSILRTRTRELDSVQDDLEQLRKVNKQQSQSLQAVRRRAEQAEHQLNALIVEEQRLRARLSTQQPSDQSLTGSKNETEIVSLQNQIRALENLARQLGEDAAQSREELSRVLREKTLLEERFLEGND